MPRKTDINTSHDKLYNFYINEIQKYNYLIALKQSNKDKAQSAGIRAMIHLYCNDIEFRDKVNSVIDDFIVYKQDGKISQL